MGNFSTNSFPNYRWDYDSDTGDKLDDAFGSIDAAIRHLFGLSVNSLTRAFVISDNGVITVQHSIGIGTSNKMIDILNVIPAAVGSWEDMKLATVHAIRTYIDGGELLAANVDVDTSNFNYILSPADVNVQLALDTIDDHLHDERYSQLGHNHDSRYYTETEINNRLNLYLPLTAGSTKRLIGNLHIGGFNDPGIFIGPESLPYFYTHIYDIGAYSYHDCFSGNDARMLFNPHPLNSAPTPPAGYMPGWGPYASIFKAYVDFFAETNTSSTEVKMRLYPGNGLRDGTPNIVLDAKSGDIDLINTGRLQIGDNATHLRMLQWGISRVSPGFNMTATFNQSSIDFVSPIWSSAGIRITPRESSTIATIDAINGITTIKFLDNIVMGQSEGYNKFIQTSSAGIKGVSGENLIKSGSGGATTVGDLNRPLLLQGLGDRPDYNAEQVAFLSDLGGLAPAAHTHPYNDYVSEVVSNGDPVTPEVLFDLDGDVVTIDIVTQRVTLLN
jgi:hypothetical protein